MIRRLTILLLIVGCEEHVQEVIIEINSHDNEIITGKIDLPKGNDPIKSTLIFVPGTGPFTYKKPVGIGNEVVDYFHYPIINSFYSYSKLKTTGFLGHY